MQNTDKYITSKMYGVPGYLTQSDARIWQILLESQQVRGITGNLAEIGVYFGRSFFLLEMLKQADELAWGCDLFSVENVAKKYPSHYGAFLALAQKAGICLNRDHIIKGDSAALDQALPDGLRGPVRFFSIDGGHHLDHLRQDCRIALQFLHPEGVIAFDDFCTPNGRK